MTSPPTPGACDLLTFYAHRALLSRGRRIHCRIISDSMKPLLQIGDRVEVEALRDPASLRRFDLLVFYQDEKLLCHYFWRFERLQKEPTVTTRSLKDFLNQDIPVPLDHVLGRVPSKEIPFLAKARVILINLLRGRG